MRFLVISALITILASCTTGYPLKSVDYTDLFTDGNSKVWVINKMIVNDVNVAQHMLKNKSVLIFHESGVVDYIALKAIGEKRPRKGKFYLDSDKRELSISFEDEEWFFDMPVMKENQIVLKSKARSKRKIKLVLVPLPQL